MIGDEYTVRVSQISVTSADDGMAGDEGVSVLTLVNVDGAWKVQQQVWDAD